MRVVFVSNYINHHQIPFSEAMVELLGEGNYIFLQTEPMEEERRNMGWGAFSLPSYVRLTYSSPQEEAECRKLVLESDAVIFGGVRDESWIRPRLEQGKFTFRYSERVYKDGQWKFITPRGLLKKYHDHTAFRKSPAYLLCAGGYVASDFRIFRSYPGKMYRWGYFPEFVPEDVDKLMAGKPGEGPVRILWAGRMYDVKHPEKAISAALFLRSKKIPFHLNFIGGGQMEETLKGMVEKFDLGREVTFLGFKSPEEVREEMRRSHIFLFTSDRREGWGAVVNEAMNSGCAVMANAMIGSVPFLIRSGWNGVAYNGEVRGLRRLTARDSFNRWLEKLATDRDCREQMGRNAYATIAEKWNAGVAAANLVALIEELTDKAVSTSGPDRQTDRSVKITDGIIPGPCACETALREGRIFRNTLKGNGS